LPGVTAKMIPEDIEPPHVPRMHVVWDESKLSKERVFERMLAGSPKIYLNDGAFGLTLVSVQLKPGEEEIVGRRLRDALS